MYENLNEQTHETANVTANVTLITASCCLLALACACLFCTETARAQSNPELTVTIESQPAADAIIPDVSLTATTLRVLDAAGNPVPDAHLRLRLDAPVGNAWFSTDFPFVEGTTLLAFDGPLPEGELNFDYIFPIRGSYQIVAEAGRTADSMGPVAVDPIVVSENGAKIRNFILLLALLVLFGLIAGYMIGRGTRRHTVSPAVVALIIVVSALLLSGTGHALAHEGEEDGQGDDAALIVNVDGEGLTLSLQISPRDAQVGTPSFIWFELVDDETSRPVAADFEVEIDHLDDDHTVFSSLLSAPTGEASMAFQFVDGAEHELHVTALADRGQVAASTHVDVIALDSSAAVKMKALPYLLLAVLAGILIGMALSGRRGRRWTGQDGGVPA